MNSQSVFGSDGEFKELTDETATIIIHCKYKGKEVREYIYKDFESMRHLKLMLKYIMDDIYDYCKSNRR